MWGTIIGGAMGLIGANKQKKAVDRQNDAMMAGFNQYKPYVDNMLEQSQDQLADQMNAGYYNGQTLAGPNAFQTNTLNTMGNFGTNMMNSGSNMMNAGSNMMNANSGFGNNANDLYGAAVGNAGDIRGYTSKFDNLYNQSNQIGNNVGNLANTAAGMNSNFNDLAANQGGVTSKFDQLYNKAANTDMMATANQYALDNYGSISDVILRDDRRNLEENTLTGIDMSASGTGNSNSSRAGVASALAQRAYDDRAADVKADTIARLRADSLGQQNTQFGMASDALTGATNSNTATGGQFGNSMNALTSAGNLYGAQNNAYNNAGAAAGNAVNNIGAVNNALTTAGGFNNDIMNAYTTGMNTYNNGLSGVQTGGDMALTAGNMFNAFDQAQLDDARTNWEGNRDYGMGVLANYNASILGRAPNSSQNVVANQNSPLAGAIGGAMQGYDFQNKFFS